ncbi:MAG: class I SAM-dependent methyltransferase [Planctomycetes bacterium]|nr:class I SAM-dependent methyltransferase [Planctomycetota bacterium]
MDILNHNRDAWNRQVEQQNCWTVPVSTTRVDRARGGEFELLLTPTRPVPRHWFPALAGLPTLCLASGGGQQGPLLAAAGAQVTVFDNSPFQLAQDRFVADRDHLTLTTVAGDMRELACFPDGSFGLIFHPCSNCFVPAIRPVWAECFRVLRPGGVLLAGFTNPVRYLFDDAQIRQGKLQACHQIPYSDLDQLASSEHHRQIVASGEPVEFGHTLEDQIGGQLDAGFLLTGFYEDRYPAAASDPLSRYLATFIATRAWKPPREVVAGLPTEPPSRP